MNGTEKDLLEHRSDRRAAHHPFRRSLFSPRSALSHPNPDNEFAGPHGESTGIAAATSVSGAGLCANAYYPARQGAAWTYKSSGGPAGEYSFTDTITSVRDDGFTLSTQTGSLTRAQEWTCKPEGLVALQLGGAPAAMLNSQNIQLNLDAKDSKGVTFPVQMNAGDGWQQSMDVTGNVTAFNEEAEAAGTAQMNFAAVGNESVTVPAGTFECLEGQRGCHT